MLDTFGFVKAIAPTANSFRRRLGTVVSIQTDYTLTVRIAGDTSSNVSGVRYFAHYAPQVGSQVWLDTDGADLIAVGAIAGLGAPVPFCKVWRNANLAIATGASYTTVTWDSETTDTHGMWSSGTNVVVPMSGTYLVEANFGFAANATGQRIAYIARAGNILKLNTIAGSSSGTQSQAFSAVARASAGDALTLSVSQNSGGNLNLYTGFEYATSLTVTYLGPKD